MDKPLEIIGEGSPGDVVIQATGKNALLFQTTMGRVANLTLRQMGGGKWFGVNIAQGRLELGECDITSQSLACVAIHDGADPRLVYCSISGYGRTGPYADWPGYDPTIQAEGGMMGITGLEEGPPYRVGVPIVDITAGMFAAGVLAALRARDHTGEVLGELLGYSAEEVARLRKRRAI